MRMKGWDVSQEIPLGSLGEATRRELKVGTL